MLLERIVRQPSSLDAALEEFRSKAAELKLEYMSEPVAIWQNTLFQTQPDVLVTCKVRRKS